MGLLCQVQLGVIALPRRSLSSRSTPTTSEHLTTSPMVSLGMYSTLAASEVVGNAGEDSAIALAQPSTTSEHITMSPKVSLGMYSTLAALEVVGNAGEDSAIALA